MAGKKYSKIYMLEVRANAGQKELVEFLITNLIGTIKAVCKTAKVNKTEMDRE